ncbi:MAG: NfeD family protein [Pontibacterium sp.]
MMEFIDQYLVQTLAVLGIAVLAIEMLVLGFSTFVLAYVGIALVLTSIAMWAGVIPVTIASAVLSSAVFTAIAWALLWKPMKNMQNKVDSTPVTSDMVGYSFVLESDISRQSPGKHHYSGIEWKVVSDTPIAAGTRVDVVELNVGEMRVTLSANAS